jgi:hypothetical protein
MNRLIQVKVSYGYNSKDNSYRLNIVFRDSLLIFVTSLEKLSKTFFF